MKAICWKCKRANNKRQDGYYWCPNCSTWYLPLEKQKIKQQFLDDDETKQM